MFHFCRCRLYLLRLHLLLLLEVLDELLVLVLLLLKVAAAVAVVSIAVPGIADDVRYLLAVASKGVFTSEELLDAHHLASSAHQE